MYVIITICFTDALEKVTIKGPTIGDIKHHIANLKQKHNKIDLHVWDSSVESASSLLLQLHETTVTYLNIHRTPITELRHYLNDTCVTKLGLWHCTIADINCICVLIENNRTLSELKLSTQKLKNNELWQILESLRVNKSNMLLSLLQMYKAKCKKYTCYQEIKRRLQFSDENPHT